MLYSAFNIQNILQADAIISNPSAEIFNIGFDSRRLSNPANSLFFALSGKNRNGIQFISDAYEKGVRNFVIPIHGFEEFITHKDANYFKVLDPLSALQLLAKSHRNLFTCPVIGITGSNGKTVVKEWLYQLLKSDFEIARSPRSYNSAIGVAISILGIEKKHNLAIIEAGISEPNEMEVLRQMIQPNLGIFTHLGTSHDANFISKSQKVAEKLKLFSNCDVVVYPADAPEVAEGIANLKNTNPLLKTYSWGFSEKASFRILQANNSGDTTEIEFIHRATTHKLSIPFTDKAGLENAMTCLCTLAAFERWDPEHIALFDHLQPVENRLVFTEGKSGNYIINDSYSNDLDSLEVALDFMIRQSPDKPAMVILSDLEQASKDNLYLYSKVAEILKAKRVNRLVGIGEQMFNNRTCFSGISGEYYANTETFIQSGALANIQNSAILIKGARHFKLEKVTELLRKKMHKTVLEIDLNAIRNNFSFFRNKLKPGTKIMAMVKAFGYGSGSFEAARALQFAGVDYLAVAYADEGVELRKSGIHTPIMVMNTGIDDLDALLEYNLEPVIFNPKGLEDFKSQAERINVHVEFDTGMHRLGFEAKDIVEFNNLPSHVHVVSVFSHLAASEDDKHDGFTSDQIALFSEICTQMQSILSYAFISHIANTGGILRFEQAHMNMVRLGIGLYGVDPSTILNGDIETVISLKTTVSQVKTIKAGESVGYGRRGVADANRTIAIIPIGYADGLWRALGNGKGYALINGKAAPYIGSICMDMAMCDVTEIECTEGDLVEVFGKELSVQTLADWCNTIPYEIFTGISQRVRRDYVGEN
ncbi:MAG: bifunctional UDP-N-acetylmuramoyl-tripeptide:D-alanyl-D-alanine ligase/alanine racemase [Bacteroidia bacterium]|nr:bifunctional UDP-N-acetylmuramoyl-tripeptide:D-alanyl-D-alanine ligase/alanine racemase [Bacteroidia bacterium]